MSNPENSGVVHYVRAISSFLTLGALAIGSFVAVNIFFSEWRALPETVRLNTETVSTLNQNVTALTESLLELTPERNIIDLLGGVAVVSPTVEAGGTLWIAFQSRANADCDRDIRIRWYSEDTRALMPQVEDVSARQSAVSEQYQLLTIPIVVPDDLPPGKYRYAPTVIPKNCASYRAQQLPMSESFEVVER